MPTRNDKESTKQREKRLAELARKIDREEGDQIKALGRSVYASLERIESVIRQLKAARLQKGLSLSDVAQRSYLDKAYLSKMENGRLPNPTLETLMRYADGIGVEVRTTIVDTAAIRNQAA